jgi:hypothetical protein
MGAMVGIGDLPILAMTNRPFGIAFRRDVSICIELFTTTTVRSLPN